VHTFNIEIDVLTFKRGLAIDETIGDRYDTIAVCAHEKASKASARVTGRQIDWMAIYTERTQKIDRTSKRESV
jgi:hypothetical protein